MKEKNTILAWVNNDNEEKSSHYLKLLCNKLNLYSASLYISTKSVPFSNTHNNKNVPLITHNPKESETILQNKILKLNPLFILTIIDHNSVKNIKDSSYIITIIKELNIPLLIIPQDHNLKVPKHIITTIGFTNRSKERAVWTNFFGKKLKAQIEALHPTEKDTYIKDYINENIYFAQKLFKQSQNLFRILNTCNRSENILEESIKFAEDKKDPILLISTRNVSILPSLFKPKELKILNKCRKIPVFLIPPNQDYTIPCH